MFAFVECLKRQRQLFTKSCIPHSRVHLVFNKYACGPEFRRFQLGKHSHRPVELGRSPQMIQLVTSKANLPVPDRHCCGNDQRGNRGRDCGKRFPENHSY